MTVSPKDLVLWEELADFLLLVPDNLVIIQLINGLPGSIKSSSTLSVWLYTDMPSSSTYQIDIQRNNRSGLFHNQIRGFLHAYGSNHDFLQSVLLGSSNERRSWRRNIIAILEVKNCSCSNQRFEWQSISTLYRNQWILCASYDSKIRRLDRISHHWETIPWW